ncbi:MAG: DUF3617 domain-containing protein [Smithella sp.]
MNKKVIILGMVIFIMLPAGFAWAAPQINPGQWEISTKTEMTGIPPQSITHTQCITNEDAVPMSNDANKECQITDIKTHGNTVTWKISCGGEGGKMNGTGSVTYSKDKMNGTMNMIILPHGTKVKNTFSGRRIGICDGKVPATTSSKVAPATQTGSGVGEVLAEDAKDVGQAAKDEVKQSTIDEVREGVRNVFRDIF